MQTQALMSSSSMMIASSLNRRSTQLRNEEMPITESGTEAFSRGMWEYCFDFVIQA